MLDEIIEEKIKKLSKDIDMAISDFFKKLGYEVRDIDELLIAQEELEEKGYRVRCETFYKYHIKNEGLIDCKTIIIPFLDSINNPLTRDEVRKISGLEDYF